MVALGTPAIDIRAVARRLPRDPRAEDTRKEDKARPTVCPSPRFSPGWTAPGLQRLGPARIDSLSRARSSSPQTASHFTRPFDAPGDSTHEDAAVES
jgi:hypothetical protein